MEKKILLSAVKPSGSLHLGNYLGAIKTLIEYQEEYKLLVFVADLHALTSSDISSISQYSQEITALYLALGLDETKTTIFLQSQVTAHTTLHWLLTCQSSMGELSRMTQYKDKVAKHQEQINVGLFTYPILMASDILLYNCDYVPVGHDQLQHLELTRTLAKRFNHRYGETFKIPEALVPKVGARVMSLQHPQKKMSKSEDDIKGTIYLLDDPQVAYQKVLKATTDNLNQIVHDPQNQPGISNLLNILSALTGEGIERIVERYRGVTTYKDFKIEVATAVRDCLIALQQRYQEVIKSNRLVNTLQTGKQQAETIAQTNLQTVIERLGLWKIGE